MTDEKIIEVEVTPEDLAEMRARGIAEEDLPPLGVKRYRPARHIVKDKVMVLLDSDLVEHFKKRDEVSFQTQINAKLRQIVESEKAKGLR
jgi:uncharacterized protein (DUF4415 family)